MRTLRLLLALLVAGGSAACSAATPAAVTALADHLNEYGLTCEPTDLGGATRCGYDPAPAGQPLLTVIMRGGPGDRVLLDARLEMNGYEDMTLEQTVRSTFGEQLAKGPGLPSDLAAWIIDRSKTGGSYSTDDQVVTLTLADTVALLSIK